MVIDTIIIKKGINYLLVLSDGKSAAKSVTVLPSSAECKRQATFSETDTEVPTRNFFQHLLRTFTLGAGHQSKGQLLVRIL